MKRGQVSMFIIAAVIIASLGIVAFVLNKEEFKRADQSQDVEDVYSFVENCIEETGYNAVDYASKRGGFFLIQEKALPNDIPYYLYDGENYMPSLEEIENQISLYMDGMMLLCLEEFNAFPEYDVNPGEISTNTKIEDEKVIFDVNYPLSVSKGDKTYTIEDFQAEIPVRLGVIYKSVSYLMDDQMQYQEGICMACVNEISQINDLYISIMDYDSGVVIFSIRDDNSIINDQSLVFNFANKYGLIEFEL